MVWVDAKNGYIPSGAVVAGKDSNHENTYIARAEHDGCVVPGKVLASHGCAVIAWDGQEHRKFEYQVLVRGPNKWVRTNNSNLPLEAFRGGESDDGEPLFVGRVDHKCNLIPGYVQLPQGICYIPFEGQELEFRDYEILMP